MWGGAVGSNHAVSIEVFDMSIEKWNQTGTGGRPHPGVDSVACASFGKFLYAYGGMDSTRRRGVLSKLDVERLIWTRICHEDANDGPMRKWECGMVIYHGCKAAVFGGYGLPMEIIQPGSKFIDDKNQHGWTNEFHVIDTSMGK